MKAVLAACTVCHLDQHYERTDQVFFALPSRPTCDVSVDFLDMSAKDRAGTTRRALVTCHRAAAPCPPPTPHGSRTRPPPPLCLKLRRFRGYFYFEDFLGAKKKAANWGTLDDLISVVMTCAAVAILHPVLIPESHEISEASPGLKHARVGGGRQGGLRF
jgi:hypothetical protein